MPNIALSVVTDPAVGWQPVTSPSDIFWGSGTYFRQVPTEVAFQFNAPAAVTIELDDFFTRSQMARLAVRFYDGAAWVEVQSSLDGTALNFTAAQAGSYCLYLNDFAYSEFTRQMASLFPSWMAVRKDQESVGQQFLNHFGLEYEELQDILDWFLENGYISTANVGQVDWVYKGDLPAGITQNHTVTVSDGTNEIPVLPTLERFYATNRDAVILDYDEGLLYSRFQYASLTITASLEVDYEGVSRTEVITGTVSLRPHHVWNTFDEFGLLLDTPRLYLETNADYRERLLDVFRYPANATRLGLYNSIARQLGLISRTVWENDAVSFTIYAPYLVPESVLVDGQPVEAIDNGDGTYSIMPQNTGRPRQVSYISGFTLHALHMNDPYLQGVLYEEDGHPTPYFYELAERLHQKAPVLWGDFRWDEGFWDITDREMSGYAFLPTILDKGV